MKINFVIGVLLGLTSIEAIQLKQKDSDEDKALAAINSAIEAEANSEVITPDKALAAVDEAEAKGTLPDAANPEGEDAKPKAADGPPPAVSDTDANGNKKTEVEMLMEKADHDELQEKWEHSAAFKKQEKSKADAKLKKQQDEVSELEETLGQVEASKQLIGKTKELNDREKNAAQDDDFLQQLFEKYAKEGKNGIQMITKDKAYIAAGKAIEHWKNLKGQENKDYLKANFQATWDEHDVHHKNKIDVTEAYQLLKEL